MDSTEVVTSLEKRDELYAWCADHDLCVKESVQRGNRFVVTYGPRDDRPVRTAVIQRTEKGYPSVETVDRYLPSGYQVTGVSATEIVISGRDYAGWTMDSYVIPRLASGMIYAREVL